MTIAIGVLCNDGVVLGADREVSLDTMHVRDKKAHLIKRDGVVVGIAGSGSADLISLAAQEIDRRLKDRTSVDGVRLLLTELASDFNKQHVAANPDAKHVLDLVVGVKTAGGTPDPDIALFKVAGTIVIAKDTYQPIGCGHELAHYLLERLYGERKRLSTSRGLILVAHVLKAVKDHVQFCGGTSDIMHIVPGIAADFISEEEVLLHERSVGLVESALTPIIHAMTDVNVDEARLNDLIGQMSVKLHSVRTNEFKDRQRQKLDDLRRAITTLNVDGLSAPSAISVFSVDESQLGAAMSDKRTQSTVKGMEIPVPRRDDFFSDLKKVAAPVKKSKNRRATKKR